jgi:hypothetical protein
MDKVRKPNISVCYTPSSEPYSIYLMTLPWTFFFYSPYSPNLSPSDFHLFTHLKQFLGVTRMRNNEEVRKIVKEWFSGLVADFYDVAI